METMNAGPATTALFDRTATLTRAPCRSEAAARTPGAATEVADAAIRRTLLARLERQPWWRPAVSNVVVIDGTAILQGLFDRQQTRAAAQALAHTVPGVQRVRDDRVRGHEWQSMV